MGKEKLMKYPSCILIQMDTHFASVGNSPDCLSLSPDNKEKIVSL